MLACEKLMVIFEVGEPIQVTLKEKSGYVKAYRESRIKSIKAEQTHTEPVVITLEDNTTISFMSWAILESNLKNRRITVPNNVP
jgi:hypothetical protein